MAKRMKKMQEFLDKFNGITDLSDLQSRYLAFTVLLQSMLIASAKC